MRRRSRAHLFVSIAAAMSWVVVAVLIWHQPTSNDAARLPFMAVTALAATLTGLGLLPLVLRDYLSDVVLAFMVGRFQTEVDEQDAREGAAPRLEVVR